MTSYFSVVGTAVVAAMLLPSGARSQAAGEERPPNVLIVLADDLGVGEVGCHGQTKIRTPHLDSLAAAGLRFTAAYAGSCVCAPSRCTLLTGLHTGHAAIRDNREAQPEGQEPLPGASVTLAEVLRARGYATGVVGKWGLGPHGSEGAPERQGFDRFYGYICQRHAHNHCPPWLWNDGARETLEGNVAGNALGPVYAPDRFRAEAEAFVRKHRERPWFLLFATTVPHAALQVPADSLAGYRDAFPETPYDGKKGYLPHATPRAAYAAMVSRMDRDVGRLLALLDELDLARRTLVVFTSDNGPTYNGGTDSAFFASTGGLRGLKGQLYEGGIRAPLIARWPGRIRPGTTSAEPVANWDLFPTAAGAAGAEVPKGLDGVDLRPIFDAPGASLGRDHLYWEHASGGGWQAARSGAWKAVRRGCKKDRNAPIELYDLAADPAEARDVSADHPDVVRRFEAVLASRTPSPVAAWNF